MPPQPVDPEREQRRRHDHLQHRKRDDDAGHRGRRQDRGHGRHMAERDRRQRAPHAARAPLLHPQRDRKEPSHSGINPVVGAEHEHRIPCHGDLASSVQA